MKDEDIDYSDIPKTTPEFWEKGFVRNRKTDEDIDCSDSPEITDEMWEKGVWRKGEKISNDQQTLFIDSDIIEFFKKQEGDYTENINRLLRNYVEAHQTEKV